MTRPPPPPTGRVAVTRPVVFTPEHVRDIRAGRKRQLRRVVRVPFGWHVTALVQTTAPRVWCQRSAAARAPREVVCPYERGQLLWVKEAWATTPLGIVYREEGERSDVQWQSPLLMPLRATRVWLRVHEVRVERLAEISPADLRAEGTRCPLHGGACFDCSFRRAEFLRAWDRTHPPRLAHSRARSEWNPIVWVISFECPRA